MTGLFDKGSLGVIVAVAAAAAVLVVSAYAAAESPNHTPGRDTKLSCVSWKAEARFVGFAYNHLVHLDNRCPHSVSCTVKTDVNPEPVTVSLSKGEKRTVLTFRGSPARRFKATVVCEKK
jgi:hypothetical protein